MTFIVSASGVSVPAIFCDGSAGPARVAADPVDHILRDNTVALGRLARALPIARDPAPIDLPEDLRVDGRGAKAVSRAAALSVAAIRLMLQAEPADPSAALFVGVGASGVERAELDRVVGSSRVDGAFSLPAFRRRGLRSFNPLRTFQSLPSFTLCHAAIEASVHGPGEATFSRGLGTVMALADACDALEDGAPEAFIGGADTGHHPITRIERTREASVADLGWLSEGAAFLRLRSVAERPIGRLLEARLCDGSEPVPPDDLFVVDAPRSTLPPRVADVDAQAVFGATLAASPALAWCLALARLDVSGVATIRTRDAASGAWGHVRIERLR